MIAYFILGLCLLVGFIFLARWFVVTEPRKVVVLVRWVLAILGLIVGGYLLWGGFQALAALALFFMLPALMRWRLIWNRLKAAQGPSPGQASEVETRFQIKRQRISAGSMKNSASAARAWNPPNSK